MPSRRQLEDLLLELFSASELRRFLGSLPAGEALEHGLPENGSLEQLVSAGISRLMRDRPVDAAFFDALARDRPRKEARIRAFALTWSASPSDPAPPLSPPDPVQAELAADLETTRSALEVARLSGAETGGLKRRIGEIKGKMRAGRQLKAGDHLDGVRYRLDRRLGTGGFGEVWLCWDYQGQEPVAIKILLPEHGGVTRERFFSGARQMGRLHHPNIVPVLNVIDPPAGSPDSELPLYVMPWMEGGDLAAALLAGRISNEQALAAVLEAGRGLAAAHAQHLVHRDVKPQNILLAADGRAALSDFDLVSALESAVRTRAGQLMGTAAYGAPEQLDDAHEAGPTADVYSLALTAAFAVSGKHPPVRGSVEGYVRGLPCSDALKGVLRKAVSERPQDRQQTVVALLAAMEGAIAARPTSKAVRQRWAVLFLAFAIVLGAGLVVLAWVAGSLKDQGAMPAPVISAAPAASPPEAPPAAENPAAPRYWSRKVTDATALGGSIHFVPIPGGSFEMGSEDGGSDEKPVHKVTISSFLLSDTELTQGQWKAVMGTSPSSPAVEGVSLLGDDLPVQNVTWLDAVAFANALSAKEGRKTAAYRIDGATVSEVAGADGYRLPTEAEWEYAARAGTTQRWAGTDAEADPCTYGNIADRTANAKFSFPLTSDCNDGVAGLAAVGSYLPNGWGLYDMTGNVWEWVWDWYGPYKVEESSDPRGAPLGARRVVRGGSWGGSATYARTSIRYGVNPTYDGDFLGLRLALTAPAQP